MAKDTRAMNSGKLQKTINTIAVRARKASGELALANPAAINRALAVMAASLKREYPRLRACNERDIRAARAQGRGAPDEDGVAGM